jgi:alkylation response protein AidB-like acyl-CoA dehydrogenase
MIDQNGDSMSTAQLRWNDYSLTDEQSDLHGMLRDYFGKHAVPSVVREAAPLGFDAALWKQLDAFGLVGLAMPESLGGQGGGLVELLLAAEEIGRTLAPVPLVEHSVAARLLARVCPGEPRARLEEAATGQVVLGFAPRAARGGTALVAAGAVATQVVVLQDDDLLLLHRATPPDLAGNQASAPLAWWDVADPEVSIDIIATGPTARVEWERARDEWKVATAAALSGLMAGAGRLARTYTTERHAFGVPLAKFQAISHQLVDIHMATESVRHLALKAAWYLENDPGARPELPAMALAHASRAATRAVADAVHVHGGLGITLEASITLYYERAAAWGQLAGGTRHEIAEIGAAIDRIAASASGTAHPAEENR